MGGAARGGSAVSWESLFHLSKSNNYPDFPWEKGWSEGGQGVSSQPSAFSALQSCYAFLNTTSLTSIGKSNFCDSSSMIALARS